MAIHSQIHLKDIELLRERLPEIRKASDRLDAFNTFSQLETGFEPIESCVQALAAKVDSAIEFEAEMLRGK